MLRLRLSRQPIRKHLPTGAGTVHSISRVSGPEALPTMGSGSPGKPPHVCGASMCGHTCVACYPRIRSRDLGWFRMMRPWDSLRDDRAHCSAPYVISFSGNNLLHIHHPSRQRRPVWTLDKLLVSTAIGAPQFFLRSPDCQKYGPRCPHSVSAPGTAVPSHSDEAIEVLAEPFDDSALHQLVRVARREA